MKIHVVQTRDEKVMNLVKIPAYKHAIFTSDVFEMENTIKTRMQSRSCYHNTLARLEDEKAMTQSKIPCKHEKHPKRCSRYGIYHQLESEFIVRLPHYPSPARGW